MTGDKPGVAEPSGRSGPGLRRVQLPAGSPHQQSPAGSPDLPSSAGLPYLQGPTGEPHWQSRPRRPGFLGAQWPIEQARYVLVGVPMDHTTSFRPGTREGPARIRQVSEGLESYSPRWRADLVDGRLADAGDLQLPWGDVVGSLELVRRCVSELAAGGRCLILLGGEHLLTLGAVQALAPRYPQLRVVQLDAHLDLREEYLGLRLSHATVMRRVGELVGLEHIAGLGVRSGVQEEWSLRARTHPVGEGSLLEQVRRVLPWVQEHPFYLSVDIDVADPAFAPGTGTPEPGGASAAELLEAVGLLAACGPVAMDVVEVCPPRDPSDVTALLAAKLVREAVCAAQAAERSRVR